MNVRTMMIFALTQWTLVFQQRTKYVEVTRFYLWNLGAVHNLPKMKGGLWYEASTNLYVWEWLLPTTSLNFTFRCKSQKCPTSKIREFQKKILLFKMSFSFIWRSFTFFMLVQSDWTGPIWYLSIWIDSKSGTLLVVFTDNFLLASSMPN